MPDTKKQPAVKEESQPVPPEVVPQTVILEPIVQAVQEYAMTKPAIFTECVYTAGGTSTRPVVSPTSALVRIGLNTDTYGIYKPGDTFLVHNEDIQTRPDVFQPVQQQETA